MHRLNPLINNLAVQLQPTSILQYTIIYYECAIIFIRANYCFPGGIEQPGVASVIGFFRRDSEPSSPIISSPTVLLIEEATSLLSPRSRAIARRGSLLELSNSVDPIQEEELLTSTVIVIYLLFVHFYKMFAAMISNRSFRDVCREKYYNNQNCFFTSNNLS